MKALEEIEELNSLITETVHGRYGLFGDRLLFIDQPVIDLKFGLMTMGKIRPELAKFNEKLETRVCLGTIEAPDKASIAEALYNDYKKDGNSKKIILVYLTPDNSIYHLGTPGKLTLKIARI